MSAVNHCRGFHLLSHVPMTGGVPCILLDRRSLSTEIAESGSMRSVHRIFWSSAPRNTERRFVIKQMDA
jgi:hypothetical protein